MLYRNTATQSAAPPVTNVKFLDVAWYKNTKECSSALPRTYVPYSSSFSAACDPQILLVHVL